MMAAEPVLSPIDAAKREFEAVKSRGADSQRALSPRFEGSAPAMETSVDAPVVLSPIQRARKLDQSVAEKINQRSSTWLLDAMKDSDESTSVEAVPKKRVNAEGSTSHGPRLKLDTLNAGDQATREDAAADLDNSRVSKSPMGAATYNPLDNYMSKWMTSRDLELMTKQAVTPSLGAPLRLLNDSDGIFSWPAARNSLDSKFSAVSSRFPGAVTPTENPYIENLSEALARGTHAPASPMPNPTATVMIATPSKLADVKQPAAPTPPSLVESLMPKDDARQFKQLKRF
jgi:hypothetical protein